MKRRFLFLIISVTSLILNAQQPETDASESGFFMNPIFAGDYPDPSILVDGDDYYVVNSSFEYYPGLTVWHSKDLINWAPVGSALTKYTGSVWAPDLVKYNNRYYIYFPANNSNYVITADSVKGPWSDPVDLKVGYIDPGHVADDDGNRYLYFSSGASVPLSGDGLSVVGDLRHSYDGWPVPRDWTIECFCMEGPKLFKHGDYYYLTVAEGGTAGPATGHMVISARSRSPLGPWENSPFNPLIRAHNDTDQWCSVGHATVFEDASGSWWMILHGYERGHYNMGRQTLLAPLVWTDDGWFKLPDGFEIDAPIKKPDITPYNVSYSYNFCTGDNTLNPLWKFFGEFDTLRFTLENDAIVVNGKGSSLAGSSPLLFIPTDHSYTAQVEVETEGEAVGGLVLFYSQKAFSGILADNNDILTNLRGWQFVAEENVLDGHVFLMLKNIDNIVGLYYSTDGEKWIKSETSLEVSGYHHNALNDFLSLRIGLVSMGKGSVRFSNFKYEPLE